MNGDYNNYLEVLYKIIDEELMGQEQSKIDEIKFIVKEMIKKEKLFEFNDDRTLMQYFLSSLIRG